MQKQASSNAISVTEQMYSVNRIHEMNKPRNGAAATNGFYFNSPQVGLGDALSTAATVDPEPFSKIILSAASFLSKLAGLFSKDPYRDIHIPAQNATVDGFARTLNLLDAKKIQGTLTQNDLLVAAAAILKLDNDFIVFTNNLAAKYPQDASRYRAGQQEVHALAMQITGGPSASGLMATYSGHFTQSGIISSAINSVTNAFGGGSIMPMVMLGAAAFFILPRILKR